MINKLLFVFLLAASGLSLANETLVQELTTSIEQHQDNIANNKIDIDNYNKKKGKIENQINEARTALNAAEKAVTSTKAAMDADPSSENTRAHKSATDLKTLAEKKVASRMKREKWLDNKLAELNKDSGASKSAISRNQRRITELRSQATEAAASLAAAEAVAKQKAEAEIAAKQQAANKLAAEKVAADNKAAELAAAATVAAAATKPSTAPVTTESAAYADELDKLEKEKAAYFSKRIASINEFLESAPSKKPIYRNLAAKIDGGEKQAFTHLGGDIYKLTTSLSKGKHKVKVRGNTFKMQVPDQHDGQEYSLYFDSRDSLRIRFFSYRTALVEK